jgi:PAS domain S-box-containing protein
MPRAVIGSKKSRRRKIRKTNADKGGVLRKTGLKFLNRLPWGTHFCQFYKTKQDLLDIMVPYHKTGLENNEMCVWITSEFLTDADVKEAMEKAVPKFSHYLEKGQIKIFSYAKRYLKEGKFGMNRALKKWTKEYKLGIKAGFDGVRISVNPFWINNKKSWNDFAEYEAGINNAISPHKLLALCAYSLDKCGVGEILDAANNHEFAIIKKFDSWTTIKSSANEKIREAVHESTRNYQALFKAMNESFSLRELVFGANGKVKDHRFLEINPAFEKFIGFKRAQIVGELRRKLPVPASPGSQKIYTQVALTGKPAHFESYNQALGKYFSVYAYQPAKNQFATIFIDISDKKKADEKIRHLALFPHNNPNPVIEIGANGKIIYLNPAGKQVIAALKPEKGSRAFLPSNIADILVNLEKKSSRHLCFHEEVNINGRIFTEEICVLGELGTARIYAKEITNQKRVEESLRESEEKYRNLVKYAPSAIYEMNLEGTKFLSVNETMCDMLGYSRSELLAINPANLMDQNSQLLFRDGAVRKKAIKKIDETVECRIRKKGGEWIYAAINMSLFTGTDKNQSRVVVIAHDITERKKIERDLKDSEERFRLALKNVPVTVAAQDMNLRYLWNYDQRAANYREIVGKTDADIFLPEEARLLSVFKRRVLETGKELRQLIWLNRGGKPSYLDIYLEPMRDESGRIKGIGIATVDMTESKTVQENLDRLNRTLKALNGVNHAVLNSKSEKEFINEVCRIIVGDCGHKMVWIGFANNDAGKTVKPAAFAGYDDGYLDTLCITWEDSVRGRGPAGTAIRTGKPQQCKNMAADPKFAPWSHEARKRGYAASIALPLIAGKKTLGVLTIYSNTENPFSIDEVRLLTELANDTSHGISTFRLRREYTTTLRELRETSEYLDNLLTYANAPIIVWDPSFKITKFNRAFEDLALIEASRAIGKPLEILFPETSKKKSMYLIKSALAGKHWETVEIPILRQDGNIRAVIWNSANIKDDNGKIVATIAQGQDITERKTAEEQRRRAQAELKEHAIKLEKAVADLKNLQLAVENASDIVFIADFKGTILSVNRAAESILGLETGHVVGRNISQFGRPVDPDFYRKIMRKIKTGGRIFSGEVASVDREGKKMVFDLKTSAVISREGKILFFVGIMRDRTEAKEIDRAKTEFISLVAHQLRTPLATMTMAAELVLNNYVGKVDAAARETIKNIYNSAHQMSGLIELFLNLSRIELGRLQINPEPLEMIDLAQDLVKLIKPQAAAKGIAFETEFSDSLPVMNVDRRIMYIALENLLTNAVKYTPEGGKIVFAMRVEKDKLAISVADTGVGIPKSQLSLIFTKMFRAANVGDIKGMGLGLNITKNTIEQGGGQIFFQSEENKGSTFSITIPLSGMKRKSVNIEF